MGLIEARNLTVQTRLAGGQRLPVLSDVSFSLDPGKVLGLVGESGAGKSMIGRAIVGALPIGFAITGGTLRLGDEDLVQPAPARRRRLATRWWPAYRR